MADSCAQYVSADDLKAAKESILHIEHVATSKDANGNPALVVTDPIRGVGYTNATLDGLFSDIGFKPVNGSFEDGGTLVNRWDVLLYETNGSFYQWIGTLPHTVPAGSSPFDSGSNLLPGWVDQSNLTIYSRLAEPDGFKYIGRCESVTALRLTEPTINKQMISLVEYTVGTGFGGGILWYDNTDTTSADNGVNIFVTSGGKRWKRLNSSVPTLIDAGGVPSISVDSSAALTRLVAVGNAGHIPDGSFSVKGVIISRTDYKLTCDGMLYLGVRASTSENNGGVPAFVGIVLQDCNGVSIQTRWHGQRALQPAEEHIYCLAVAGGSQIDIDLDAQEVAGDGLYVSQSNWLASSTIPSHVSINARVRNSALSGRNAVSIISLDNFKIKLDCKNVGGVIATFQQPGGLDLEPNFNYQTITNGQIELIADNCAFGLCFFGKSYNIRNVTAVAQLSNNCRPYLSRFQECDVTVNNKDSAVAGEVNTCLDSKLRFRHYNCAIGVSYGYRGDCIRCDIETSGSEWVNSVASHFGVQDSSFSVKAYNCAGGGDGFAWVTGIPDGQTSAYVPSNNRYSIDCPKKGSAVYAIRNASGLSLSRCILCNSNLGGWNNWGEAVLGQVANVIESTVCNTLSSSNAIPTSGYYPQGHIVRANSNTVTTGQVLYGWLRLTTGSGHVLDTDWKAVRFNW